MPDPRSTVENARLILWRAMTVEESTQIRRLRTAEEMVNLLDEAAECLCVPSEEGSPPR